MRLAEILMRVGAALVGFMVGLAHCLTLLVVPRISCDIPANDPFLASLALGAALAALLLITSWGRPFRASLRWLTLPFAALVPLAAYTVWPYLGSDGAAEIARCSAAAGLAAPEIAARWQRLWAPLQLAVLALLAFQALRYWRAPEPPAP